MSSDEDGVRKVRFGIRSSEGGVRREAVVERGGWKRFEWYSISAALVPRKLAEFTILVNSPKGSKRIVQPGRRMPHINPEFGDNGLNSEGHRVNTGSSSF